MREEIERTQATLGKSQLQQEKLQNSLDKAQNEVDHLQEKLDKATGEIRRVMPTHNWDVNSLLLAHMFHLYYKSANFIEFHSNIYVYINI